MRHAMFCLFSLVTLVVSATEQVGFTQIPDVAQYSGSDYANVVQVERNITLNQAFEIAENNPDIDYFVYLKGEMMVLQLPQDVVFDSAQDPFGLVSFEHYLTDSWENKMGYCRVFRHGDTVFFKNEGQWLGSAPGLADAYFKNEEISSHGS